MAHRTAAHPRVQQSSRSRTAVTTREDAAHTDMRSLLIVWGAWFVLMTGINLATPLYAVYAHRFGFSSLVLTAIFTAYAVVLVPSLLLFGRLSDRFGRRPVVVAGLVTACAGLALFAAAQGTAWLFGARLLLGLAVGMISGPATAALVEFDPRRDEQRPALLAGLAQAGGSAAGPLATGVLAQWGPAPRQLAFLLVLGVTLVAAAVTLRLPEPARGEPESWRIQWPRVPAELRSDFARVSLTAATVWGTVALFLAIVPSYASDLLGTHNLALLGVIAAVALAASCVAQIVSQHLRLPTPGAQATGLALLALGLGALVVASPLHSLTVLLLGAVAAGFGHGIGFLSAQDELNTIAPAGRRGEVTAAFIGCIYLVVGSSVIGTGLLDRWLSLSTAVSAIAAVLVAAAVATIPWHIKKARSRS
jgi:MFS family permease